MYYGKVYYWFEALQLHPVKFEEYLAGAGLVEWQAVSLQALRLAGIAAAAPDSRSDATLAQRLARYPACEAVV